LHAAACIERASAWLHDGVYQGYDLPTYRVYRVVAFI
jgi:hypothetical protein